MTINMLIHGGVFGVLFSSCYGNDVELIVSVKAATKKSHPEHDKTKDHGLATLLADLQGHLGSWLRQSRRWVCLLVSLLRFHTDALKTAPLGFPAHFPDIPSGGAFLLLASTQRSQPCGEIPGLR